MQAKVSTPVCCSLLLLYRPVPPNAVLCVGRAGGTCSSGSAGTQVAAGPHLFLSGPPASAQRLHQSRRPAVAVSRLNLAHMQNLCSSLLASCSGLLFPICNQQAVPYCKLTFVLISGDVTGASSLSCVILPGYIMFLVKHNTFFNSIQ